MSRIVGSGVAVEILLLLTCSCTQFLGQFPIPTIYSQFLKSFLFPLHFLRQLMDREILRHWTSFISMFCLLFEKRPLFNGIHNGLIQMEGTWGVFAGSTAAFLSTPHHLCSSGLGHPQKIQPNRSLGQAPGHWPVPGHLTACLNLSNSQGASSQLVLSRSLLFHRG